ncbi:MAG TPA: NADH-ubiquinone oxidoreductase-F iron-sulfur binding region domain-containing protein [Acidimicrobiales bacterium]|nr:NADH-ubiquinone oxidoreductase-F iron-sulfur binding region domain-containing protein [Acidimicrobiales bacterium]
MSTPATAMPPATPAASALPRLLTGIVSTDTACGLDEHLARWGPSPVHAAAVELIDVVGNSGLRGRGGAGFPVAQKWRSIGGGRLRKPVVVANGAEGEPTSAKDALLLGRLPHLVLDGLSLAGAAVNASRLVVYVPTRLARGVEDAVEERRRLGIDPVPINVVVAPDRFLAGQESAVVNVIDGGREARPSFVAIESVRDRGVNGRPTLVQNVETLAHVSLIARFGRSWFRALGTEKAPGTMLVTVTGRWPESRILEAPLGAPIHAVLGLSYGEAASFQGALLGGYGGGWVTMPTLLDLPLTEEAARQAGSSLGPGIIALLPHRVCPLAEAARVARYMQEQGAGQCGPCVHGLADLAGMLEELAFRPFGFRGGIQGIAEVCDLVEGRGACRHPDGVARFVRSSLAVFSDEAASHLRNGPCQQTRAPGFLPCPHSAVPVRGEPISW